MVSPTRLFFDILLVVIRNVWTVLFFLSSLSLLSLANHFWEDIAGVALHAQTLILNGIDYLRAL